ncbi:MAG: hypothetical protein APF84_14755 [Gracilibacter sp. BRH_c7a]|nr:MAG: hypothetical protein APF84_14755 [Gracilibacter sp. BRH_c7a]
MKKQLILNMAAVFLALFMAWLFYYESLDLPKVAYQLPRMLTYLITILAIILIIESYLKYRKTTEEVQEEGIMVRRTFLFICSIALYIYLIDFLGYFITTPLFIFGSMYFLKATKIRNILYVTIGFTLFVYLLFVRFLHLPIPLGPLS